MPGGDGPARGGGGGHCGWVNQAAGEVQKTSAQQHTPCRARRCSGSAFGGQSETLTRPESRALDHVVRRKPLQPSAESEPHLPGCGVSKETRSCAHCSLLGCASTPHIAPRRCHVAPTSVLLPCFAPGPDLGPGGGGEAGRTCCSQWACGCRAPRGWTRPRSSPRSSPAGPPPSSACPTPPRRTSSCSETRAPGPAQKERLCGGHNCARSVRSEF